MNTSSALLCMVLLCTLLITSCDEPKAENTKEDEKASTEYTFAFTPKEEHKQAFAERTYIYAVTETNKAEDDTRDIRYTSSSMKIATVDNTGTVTFVTAGTVIITATKEAAGDHEEVSDSYTLYITMKPADKNALVNEIKRAMTAHGNEVNLNYIDTSAITDMSGLFSDGSSGRGYELQTFNGDISKWDVSEVTTMFSMFKGAKAFTQNLDAWEKTIKFELINSGYPIGNMFHKSGLKDNLPLWCKNNPTCKSDSLSFS